MITSELLKVITSSYEFACLLNLQFYLYEIAINNSSHANITSLYSFHNFP